jgi:hypothetical protein
LTLIAKSGDNVSDIQLIRGIQVKTGRRDRPVAEGRRIMTKMTLGDLDAALDENQKSWRSIRDFDRCDTRRRELPAQAVDAQIWGADAATS